MTAARLARIAALGACLTLLAATGCRLGDLSFRADKRVEITAPENRATVKLPFELTWTAMDFKVVGKDGSENDRTGFFAVLLDNSPMPPGETLSYFARDDDTCRESSGCPDKTYLADRNIFTTETTSFTIDSLADGRPTDRPSAQDDHDITIVLLNGKGERIGESAFRRTVVVDRSGF